jgi:hypothetical protein
MIGLPSYRKSLVFYKRWTLKDDEKVRMGLIDE